MDPVKTAGCVSRMNIQEYMWSMKSPENNSLTPMTAGLLTTAYRALSTLCDKIVLVCDTCEVNVRHIESSESESVTVLQVTQYMDLLIEMMSARNMYTKLFESSYHARFFQEWPIEVCIADFIVDINTKVLSRDGYHFYFYCKALNNILMHLTMNERCMESAVHMTDIPQAWHKTTHLAIRILGMMMQRTCSQIKGMVGSLNTESSKSDGQTGGRKRARSGPRGEVNKMIDVDQNASDLLLDALRGAQLISTMNLCKVWDSSENTFKSATLKAAYKELCIAISMFLRAIDWRNLLHSKSKRWLICNILEARGVHFAVNDATKEQRIYLEVLDDMVATILHDIEADKTHSLRSSITHFFRLYSDTGGHSIATVYSDALRKLLQQVL